MSVDRDIGLGHTFFPSYSIDHRTGLPYIAFETHLPTLGYCPGCRPSYLNPPRAARCCAHCTSLADQHLNEFDSLDDDSKLALFAFARVEQEERDACAIVNTETVHHGPAGTWEPATEDEKWEEKDRIEEWRTKIAGWVDEIAQAKDMHNRKRKSPDTPGDPGRDFGTDLLMGAIEGMDEGEQEEQQQPDSDSGDSEVTLRLPVRHGDSEHTAREDNRRGVSGSRDASDGLTNDGDIERDPVDEEDRHDGCGAKILGRFCH